MFVLDASFLVTLGVIAPAVFDAIFALIWVTLNQHAIYFVRMAGRISRGKFGLVRTEISSLKEILIFPLYRSQVNSYLSSPCI
jgi:hypothetical protein